MKKGDLIIGLIIVLVMAIMGIGYKVYSSGLGDNLAVEISVNDEVIKSVELTNGVDETFTVITDNGKFIRIDDGATKDETYDYNVIHVYNGGFEVIEADCSGQDDVKQGFVKMPLLSVVCAPHHLEIQIVGNDINNEGPDDVAS